MTPASIGRFPVERLLGSGSFATVWLARDEDLDGLVAIKLLADNWSLNEDARRRFTEEARALRRLDSDRVVRVYETGRLDDGRPYMVMEFADRGTLEDRMRLRAQLGQPFSVTEAVAMSVEIAECLISVHDLRMVHRDVKPSNVLFRSTSPEVQEAMRRDGRPVIVERTLLGDFGIARRLEGVLGPTMLLGSPHYMAPEQSDPARAGHADYRSDVYSSAVVMYEMLAGRLPHRFDSMTELQRSDRVGPPAPIRSLRPEVPERLAKAIGRGLARDPDRRFATAREWRDAVRDGIAGTGERRMPGSLPASRGPDTVSVAAPTAPSVPAGAVSGRPSREAGTAVAPTRAGTARLPHVVSTAPVGAGEAWNPSRPFPERSRPHPAASAGAGPGPALPVRPVDLRVPSVGVLLAGLLVLVGTLLPWSGDRASTAFGTLGMVIGLAAVLLICGWRVWRTPRRWVAITLSALAMTAGVLVASAAAFESIGALGETSLGLGLLVVFGAGLIGMASGHEALNRLRRDPRHWDRRLRSRPSGRGARPRV